MNGYSPKDFCDFIDAPVRSNKLPDKVPAEDGNESFFSESIYSDSDCRTGSDNRTSKTTLPEVLLFKDLSGVRIIDTAESLGNIFEKKEILFRRGTVNDQAQQVQILDKERNLKILSPELACSEFEKVANLVYYKNRRTVPAILKESDSKRILCCSSFIEKLPLLRIVTKCPVIVETSDGNTKIITRYDPDTGIYAMGEKPEDVDIKDAIAILLSSIEEFHFKSSADKSRAVASIITPALIMGGIAYFRSPIELIEADDSQAGKGFKAKISAAYYNETPYPVNQQRGGVGSLEESFNQALIEGRIFINLDNLKPVKGDVFDSEKICSFMTEDNYYARMLRRGMFINPKLHIIQMTTNGCSLSKDLMNRALPIAILKRNEYSYKKYPEGSILDHIRHNQPKHLGAVFSIIREWVRQGKRRTSTTAHESSFTPCVQSLDWIIQNIMELAPLLDGYVEVRNRMTSQNLQTHREIALVIIKKRKDQWLTASDILEEIGYEGIKLPGTDKGYDYETMTEEAKKNVKIQLGRSFQRAFNDQGNNEVLILDGIRIIRKEFPKTYENCGTTRNVKHYKYSDQ